MDRRISYILAAAVSLGMVFSFDNTAFARRDAVNKEKKLEDINKRLRDTKKTISETEKKEENILELLDGYNKELKAYRGKLTSINDSIMTVQGELKEANANLSLLDRERIELKGRLGRRLRGLYKMRNGWIMRVVFSDATSGEIANRYKLMSLVLESDRKLIKKAEDNSKEWEAEKKRYSALEKNLIEAKREAVASKKEIEKKLAERRNLLAGVRKKKESYVRLEKDLENAKNGLMELINSLKSTTEEAEEDDTSGFAAMKGRLDMPVAGKVISTYGKVRHPKFNTVTFNNGIIIESPYGQSVKSVYAGKVVYVGWLKGYGQVLIVDNSGGYYTLYAYLSETFKKNGDFVEAGEKIALVGDSGSSGVVGLYFEVRQKGVPRDPSAWLAFR